MEVKTHATMGIATALAVTVPQNTSEIIITCAAELIGGLISDIDALNSTAHNKVVQTNVLDFAKVTA